MIRLFRGSGKNPPSKLMDNQDIYNLLKELKVDLKEDLREIREVHLFEIKEQVKRTNSRVSTLESWRSMLAGAIAVLASIPLISQIIKLLNK